MTSSPLPRRLDFLLHDFVRISWVSAQAHAVWSSRLQRIARAWPKIELASVALGVRSGALLQLSPEGYLGAAQVATHHNLVAVTLGDPNGSDTPTGNTEQSALKFSVFIGDEPVVKEFIAAWNAKASHEIGQLLGYPACCVKAFTNIWGPDGWLDSTWRILNMTQQPDKTGLTVDLDSTTSINVFWRYLGIRNVPHLPCTLGCPATKELSESFVETGKRAGFAEEMMWLQEVLAWPVEWSALHGIAEIKTPILKILTGTDATAAKLTARWHSSTYPAEGGKGVRFPYAAVTPGLVTLSKSYQRGIDHAKTVTADSRTPHAG